VVRRHHQACARRQIARAEGARGRRQRRNPFHPGKRTNTYRQWLTNIQDWCISRQLWWGHQIPAWYAAEDEGKENPRFWVAHDETEAAELAAADGYTGPLVRDPDVLDTWYSSALWPFSTLDWTPEYPAQSNPALDLYLPSSVLVTGFDIIFFWVRAW
jgi:valyl-tRNA synthetase